MKKVLILLSIFFIGLSPVYGYEKVEFYKCVDGDTFRIKLDNQEYYVRMLAIDTPESVKENSKVEYYGKEASEYTCNKLMNAKKIELEYDDKSDKVDKYDRLLAWVYVDGKLLQEDLVESGYAEVAYLYDDYKYVDRLNEKQEIASNKEIGIWNTNEKNKYDNNYNEKDIDDSLKLDDMSNMEVIIVVILLILLVLFGKMNIIKKN